MDDLTYTLRQLCQRNRDGSHNTQADRMRSRAGCAATARGRFPADESLVAQGQARPGTARTLAGRRLVVRYHQNRLSHLRWWAEKISKSGVLPADNTQLGVTERRYVTNISKARELGTGLEQITDVHVRMSLQLQAAFGLRREEAIKFQPSYADRGTTSPSRDRGRKAAGSERCPSPRQSNATRSRQHTTWQAQGH